MSSVVEAMSDIVVGSYNELSIDGVVDAVKNDSSPVSPIQECLNSYINVDERLVQSPEYKAKQKREYDAFWKAEEDKLWEQYERDEEDF